MNIFLSVSLNICFGCSKEPSHRDSSFEYPQHMFWLGNKKTILIMDMNVQALVYKQSHLASNSQPVNNFSVMS